MWENKASSDLLLSQ